MLPTKHLQIKTIKQVSLKWVFPKFYKTLVSYTKKLLYVFQCAEYTNVEVGIWPRCSLVNCINSADCPNLEYNSMSVNRIIKCWRMLGTHGHWAVRVLWHLLKHGIYNNNGDLWGPETPMPGAVHLAVELSLPVLAVSLLRLEFEHPTVCMQDESSNRLIHRSIYWVWNFN